MSDPVPPNPVPLSAERFFELRPPATGVRPCRRLGIGTAWIGRTDVAAAADTLHAAWSEGFELTDTAPMYGVAEERVGHALSLWKGPRPVIATKTLQSDAVGAVREWYLQSVASLGAIDLLAVHDASPDYTQEDRSAIAGFVAGLLRSGELQAAGIGGGGPLVQSQWLAAGIFRYVITYQRLDAISLQGLADTVPNARAAGARVWAASPLHFGLLAPDPSAAPWQPPDTKWTVFRERASAVRRLTQAAGLPITHVAIRFVLSLPEVDLLLVGPRTREEWADCRRAYEAGPLPQDLYQEVWRIAHTGEAPQIGG